MNSNDEDGANSPPGGARASRARTLLSRATEAARQLPGAERVEARLRDAERQVLGELRNRMQSIEDSGRMIAMRGPSVESDLAKRFDMLMAQSAEHSKEEAELLLFNYIIEQLLPDEARILAALSDGSAHAVVHVGTGPRIGPLTQVEFRNLSSIGRVALVKLRDEVPLYLDHLRELRLVRIDKADPALETDYQLLESDAKVMAWQRELPSQWNRSVRTQRRTVALSSFGRRFWDALHRGR